MDLKTTVSAKGQIVIPTIIRESMGLHCGSELIIHMRADSILEFKPIKKKLSDFFGMGSQKHRLTSPIDIDRTIAEAVVENNPDGKKEPS